MKGIITSSIFTAVTLVSCAVEPIKLNAPIDVPVAQNKVNGLNIRVSIEDVRNTQEVGSRGGLYSETSIISTDDSLIDQIGGNFIQALKNQGYQLVAKAPANMKVKLDTLTYEVDEINRTTKDSKVFAQMSFYVEHSKGYIQKSFNVTLEQTTVLLPSQKSIEALINDSLLQVMQKGLDDKDIQTHIASSQSMGIMPVTSTQIPSEQTQESSESQGVSQPEPVEELPAPVEPIEPVESKTFKILL